MPKAPSHPVPIYDTFIVAVSLAMHVGIVLPVERNYGSSGASVRPGTHLRSCCYPVLQHLCATAAAADAQLDSRAGVLSRTKLGRYPCSKVNIHVAESCYMDIAPFLHGTRPGALLEPDLPGPGVQNHSFLSVLGLGMGRHWYHLPMPVKTLSRTRISQNSYDWPQS